MGVSVHISHEGREGIMREEDKVSESYGGGGSNWQKWGDRSWKER